MRGVILLMETLELDFSPYCFSGEVHDRIHCYTFRLYRPVSHVDSRYLDADGDPRVHVCSCPFCTSIDPFSPHSHHLNMVRGKLEMWLETLGCMSISAWCGGCPTSRLLYLLVPCMHSDHSSPHSHHPIWYPA